MRAITLLTSNNQDRTLLAVRPNGGQLWWRPSSQGITGWGGDGCPSGEVFGLPRPPPRHPELSPMPYKTLGAWGQSPHLQRLSTQVTHASTVPRVAQSSWRSGSKPVAIPRQTGSKVVVTHTPYLRLNCHFAVLSRFTAATHHCRDRLPWLLPLRQGMPGRSCRVVRAEELECREALFGHPGRWEGCSLCAKGVFGAGEETWIPYNLWSSGRLS